MLFSAYPEEGEVPAAVDAGDLKVAHDDFTVFIILPQSSVLLVQVREGAELVFCTSTHWGKKKNRKHIC